MISSVSKWKASRSECTKTVFKTNNSIVVDLCKTMIIQQPHVLFIQQHKKKLPVNETKPTYIRVRGNFKCFTRVSQSFVEFQLSVLILVGSHAFEYL